MEMEKLILMLQVAGIPFETRDCYGTPQVGYPAFGVALVCDAICHAGSYGHEAGLLEIMGLTDSEEIGDVQGYLTAEDVFHRIFKHWISNPDKANSD